MRIEIDGIEIDVRRDDDVVEVQVQGVRSGHRRPLGHWYLNADEDSASGRISAHELRGAGLAVE